MSFNRLDYDTCAYAKKIQESTEPLDYWLFLGKYESCNHCETTDYTNNLDFTVRTQVENDLKGQTRKGTKCPKEKFPLNTEQAVGFSPAIICQSIYKLTPSNVVKPTTSGLKNINSYNQNNCSILNK